MGNIRRQYITEKIKYPVNNNNYSAEVRISIDGGETFHSTNVKEYFATEAEAIAFCDEYAALHK